MTRKQWSADPRPRTPRQNHDQQSDPGEDEEYGNQLQYGWLRLGNLNAVTYKVIEMDNPNTIINIVIDNSILLKCINNEDIDSSKDDAEKNKYKEETAFIIIISL